MGAGLEHLSWAGGTVRHVDLLLVVVEPNRKTRMTAARTDRLARQLQVARVAMVANRIGAPEDEERARAFAAELGREVLAIVPEDEAVIAADQAGRCILDMAPHSPAVHAIQLLADVIENHLSGSRPLCSPNPSEPGGTAASASAPASP